MHIAYHLQRQIDSNRKLMKELNTEIEHTSDTNPAVWLYLQKLEAQFEALLKIVEEYEK